MTATTLHNPANTDAVLLSPIHRRWSTRAFDPAAVIDDETLNTLLEAARWAPSAGNTQPWRFIVARRGSDEFQRIAKNLRGANAEWAPNASVLIITLAEKSDEDGNPRPFGQYDLGQSVAYLTLQAVELGLTVRQMGGVERDAIRAAFDVPERLDIVTAVAIGHAGDAETVLNEELRGRETLPRERKAVPELLYEI